MHLLYMDCSKIPSFCFVIIITIVITIVYVIIIIIIITILLVLVIIVYMDQYFALLNWEPSKRYMGSHWSTVSSFGHCKLFVLSNKPIFK